MERTGVVAVTVEVFVLVIVAVALTVGDVKKQEQALLILEDIGIYPEQPLVIQGGVLCHSASRLSTVVVPGERDSVMCVWLWYAMLVVREYRTPEVMVVLQVVPMLEVDMVVVEVRIVEIGGVT